MHKKFVDIGGNWLVNVDEIVYFRPSVEPKPNDPKDKEYRCTIYLRDGNKIYGGDEERIIAMLREYNDMRYDCDSEEAVDEKP